jgi:hypothetical protein
MPVRWTKAKHQQLWTLSRGRLYLGDIAYFEPGEWSAYCRVNSASVRFGDNLEEAKRWLELEAVHAIAREICEGEL